MYIHKYDFLRDNTGTAYYCRGMVKVPEEILFDFSIMEIKRRFKQLKKEWIIENLTEDEEKILVKNDIEWYPDDILNSRDIVFHGSKKELDNVLILIGRKTK